MLTARAILGGGGTTLGEVYVLTFAILAWQVFLYTFDRPIRAKPHQQAALDRLNVTVAVPCYNEDPEILRRSLLSMLAQTRLPDHVYIVDDGSTAADYTAVRREFAGRAAAVGVRSTWIRTANGGKRHAHAVAVQGTPDADIYVTIDSDGILSESAIAELLAPFTDPEVQSVAGVVLSANNRSTILARILDLIYLPSQLTGRAGLSLMGSVLVNSGALAAYRAQVVREALPVYLGETFFRRPVGFSDDSMLTLHAYLRGRTVQQASAFVFAAMPERFSHHMRQYLRWMRGSFIRSWWRFRYLPVLSYAYWWHLLGWIMSAVSAWAFIEVFVLGPVKGDFHPSYLLVPVLLGYGAALPYLTVARSDESFWSRLATWMLAPLATVWAFTVMRAWRWYGALTCRRTGWGTRKTIELAMDRQQ
ncbi:MAG TPA: glycosyltransferase [Trebonia sp.]|nr:glycosyltransferase [Trebonia sp.]